MSTATYTTKASPGPLDVAVLLHRLYLHWSRDVIQCSDWLTLLNITSYPIHHLSYVISHAFGSTLHGRSTKLGYLNKSSSKASQIVQRGNNNLLRVGSVTSTKTRGPGLAFVVSAAVDIDHHHCVVCGCISGNNKKLLF